MSELRDRTITGEQLRCMLHISKRKMAWLLCNGYIPCTISEGKTRKYQICMSDVQNFLHTSEYNEEQVKIPSGLFSNSNKSSTKCFTKLLPESFRPWLEKRWSNSPEILTTKQIVDLTGYSKSAVNEWIAQKSLRTTFVSDERFTILTWLIDFFCTKAYSITRFSKIHMSLLQDFFEEQNL